MKYIFDGSYYGLLCCVFAGFERKEFNYNPILAAHAQDNLFEKPLEIFTDAEKANRILNSLENKISKTAIQDFYRAYLSENPKTWFCICRIIESIFKGQLDILQNYGNDEVIYLSQMLKRVSRERHRMKAFIRFNKSSDGLFVAIIEPDFNVLPLIISFFRNRYADQKWLIYDVKRHYGVYYDLHIISEVVLSPTQSKDLLRHDKQVNLDEKDADYELLWQSYFQSTNIPARKNMKLHLQHVPKRYWKYLPEKKYAFLAK